MCIYEVKAVLMFNMATEYTGFIARVSSEFLSRHSGSIYNGSSYLLWGDGDSLIKIVVDIDNRSETYTAIYTQRDLKTLKANLTVSCYKPSKCIDLYRDIVEIAKSSGIAVRPY